MDARDLSGKRFALLLTDEDKESVVFGGTIWWDGRTLLLQRSGEPDFEIRDDWYERIEPVPDSVKAILLDAEFFLMLSVGNLADEDRSKFAKTGLQWPRPES